MFIYSVNAHWRGPLDKKLKTKSVRTADTTALRNGLFTHKRPVDSDDALFRKGL